MELKKKCEVCGKEISSLYLLQLEYNLRIHMMTHKKNKEDKNE